METRQDSCCCGVERKSSVMREGKGRACIAAHELEVEGRQSLCAISLFSLGALIVCVRM